MKTNFLLALSLVVLSSLCWAKSPSKTLLFVGSYTNNQPNDGIYVYQFNDTTAEFTKLYTVTNITNPSFLTLSSDGKFLYACNDTRLPKPGAISAFSVNPNNGELTFLNKVESGGENPVYVSTTRNNQWLITGNYSSGSATAIGINKDGSLLNTTQTIVFKDSSINKQRQTESHIHAAYFSPDNQWVFFPDLGADKVRVFKFNRNAHKPIIETENNTIRTSLGGGPRHFAFHPNQRWGYLAEELNGMISAYHYKNGSLKEFQKVFSYSKKYNAYGTADIHITPNGKFLYASNRLNDENTLSIFRIDKKTGRLSLVGHQKTGGDHPRNFAIDPTGRFLLVANMNTNNIVIFSINQKTGILRKINQEISVPNPSCLVLRQY